MKRTTISLPDALAFVLQREARRRGTSVSKVTREALSDHFGLAAGSRRRDVPFAAVGSSSGGNIAERMEEILDAEWADHIGGDEGDIAPRNR